MTRIPRGDRRHVAVLAKASARLGEQIEATFPSSEYWVADTGRGPELFLNARGVDRLQYLILQSAFASRFRG